MYGQKMTEGRTQTESVTCIHEKSSAKKNIEEMVAATRLDTGLINFEERRGARQGRGRDCRCFEW